MQRSSPFHCPQTDISLHCQTTHMGLPVYAQYIAGTIAPTNGGMARLS